ncbi:MAG: hypothetical protein Q8N81_06290, partial [bacterium]|nr:hypothetical protein [bacterium]
EKNKYLIGVIAGLVVLAAIIAIVKYSGQKPETSPDNNATSNKTLPLEAGKNQLVGELKKTDDIESGNLMLITTDKKLYLNTTRDFNSLVGKQVVVTIDGDSQNFRLIDIKEK